jgi:hypothetical protein
VASLIVEAHGISKAFGTTNLRLIGSRTTANGLVMLTDESGAGSSGG